MSSTTTEGTDGPVEPRFQSQLEGEGWHDARELLYYNGKREPVRFMRDTFTHEFVVVFMARPTGDPAVFWVVRKEGKAKVRLSTARYEPVGEEHIQLQDMTKIIVPRDTAIYRRLRSQPDRPRIE